MNMFDLIKQILILEKQFTETHYERLKKDLVYIKRFDRNR